MTTTIEIDNLKCGGCANTIRKELGSIPGISVLEVNPDLEKVIVESQSEPILETVKKKLRELGYPEKGTVSGLKGLAAEAKSYVSCMIGKLSKKE